MLYLAWRAVVSNKPDSTMSTRPLSRLVNRAVKARFSGCSLSPSLAANARPSSMSKPVYAPVPFTWYSSGGLGRLTPSVRAPELVMLVGSKARAAASTAAEASLVRALVGAALLMPAPSVARSIPAAPTATIALRAGADRGRLALGGILKDAMNWALLGAGTWGMVNLRRWTGPLGGV